MQKVVGSNPISRFAATPDQDWSSSTSVNGTRSRLRQRLPPRAGVTVAVLETDALGSVSDDAVNVSVVGPCRRPSAGTVT